MNLGWLLLLLILHQLCPDYDISFFEFEDALDELIMLSEFNLSLNISSWVIWVFRLWKAEELFGAKSLENFSQFHQKLKDEEGELTLKLVWLQSQILFINVE